MINFHSQNDWKRRTQESNQRAKKKIDCKVVELKRFNEGERKK